MLLPTMCCHWSHVYLDWCTDHFVVHNFVHDKTGLLLLYGYIKCTQCQATLASCCNWHALYHQLCTITHASYICSCRDSFKTDVQQLFTHSRHSIALAVATYIRTCIDGVQTASRCSLLLLNCQHATSQRMSMLQCQQPLCHTSISCYRLGRVSLLLGTLRCLLSGHCNIANKLSLL